jgi:hypothetical protein
MPIEVNVYDYRALYAKCKTVEPVIRRGFRKGLRNAGKIGQGAAKAKVLAWPAAGGISAKAGGKAHRGLRATVAANVRVSVTARDVRIRQYTAGLTGNSASDLPRDIDRGYWKHPTYGHRPTVLQRGTPYFKAEISSKRDEMLREVRVVLDDVRDHLS